MPRVRPRSASAEREIGEVRGAVMLAAARRPSRVLVCNLSDGAAAMAAVHDFAEELDVELEAIARSSGRGSDVLARGR